ncbi:hypothetical protein RFN28_00795 [Mesorhizobium sp. VK24D]|uniref:Uncharacterized protein n=1 Tax=Mesorhizobium album TaxID=3072314 RepID=A0ABU4XSH1_9HYPH|nr:hypothetical protein [Mesorhizobium sp. VK24D]MDX8477008.1 hypothetical protein [Mesorhizobium sp. VK24D]
MNEGEPKLREIYSRWARETWSLSKFAVRQFVRTKPAAVVFICTFIVIPTVGVAAYFGASAALDRWNEYQDDRVLRQRREVEFARLRAEQDQQDERLHRICIAYYDPNALATNGSVGGRSYSNCRQAELYREDPATAHIPDVCEEKVGQQNTDAFAQCLFDEGIKTSLNLKGLIDRP